MNFRPPTFPWCRAKWRRRVVQLSMFRIYRHMRLCTTVYLHGARWFCVVCPLMPMVRSPLLIRVVSVCWGTAAARMPPGTICPG
jgi:hypothetical protein